MPKAMKMIHIRGLQPMKIVCGTCTWQRQDWGCPGLKTIPIISTQSPHNAKCLPPILFLLLQELPGSLRLFLRIVKFHGRKPPQNQYWGPYSPPKSHHVFHIQKLYLAFNRSHLLINSLTCCVLKNLERKSTIFECIIAAIEVVLRQRTLPLDFWQDWLGYVGYISLGIFSRDWVD